MLGKTILHYKILEKLGQGGMGVVYKAEDTKLERLVAIKFLPRYIAGNEEERKRFVIEAKAAAALNHPNIAHIYSIEETEDEMFIVMEYIDGLELKDKIKSGLIPTDEAINIAIQIADGLESAHKKGIVHRDVKSQNIILTDDGKVKIMDFGVVKMKGKAQLTKAGSTLGTLEYMSPEQVKGEEVDQQSDIWSFGVVLYEMLTGYMPFSGDYDAVVVYSILNEDAPLDIVQDSTLRLFLKKCLEKEKVNRYRSATEILKELRIDKQISGEVIKEKKVKANTIKSRVPVFIILSVVGFILALALWLLLSRTGIVGETEEIKTIAVLPFADVSQEKDHEYFSDGLSEELLNVLAKNPQLRVTSRTSSFSFKGTNTDIKTIAEKLNVEHILEGSVRKAGNEIRITAQLIDVKTDAHLWSETYDATLENVFALQDSISGSVAEALKITLLVKESATQQRETDPQAYNAYLLGKHFYNLRGEENFEKAADYYQQALAIDPGYAPAWVGLSLTHSAQTESGYLPVDEGYHKARQEVDKALGLDPNLADAHSQLGWIKLSYNWDWNGADESFRRALELEPRNAFIIGNAAILARTLGLFNEAIKLAHRSVEINPVSAVGYHVLGVATWYAGLLDDSQAAFRKCLELNPQFPGEQMRIGIIYLTKGQGDSALAEIMKESEPVWQLYGNALLYHSLGKTKEADDKLAEFMNKWQNDAAFQIAEIYAWRGEKDKAFHWLERAYEQHDGGLTAIKGDPRLRNIEKDPRYVAFLKKMNLPL